MEYLEKEKELTEKFKVQAEETKTKVLKELDTIQDQVLSQLDDLELDSKKNLNYKQEILKKHFVNLDDITQKAKKQDQKNINVTTIEEYQNAIESLMI